MIFRRATGTDSWHFCTNGSQWPTRAKFEEVDFLPVDGHKCKECVAQADKGECKPRRERTKGVRVFGGPHDLHQQRYTSQAAAMKGHERMVAFAKDQGN